MCDNAHLYFAAILLFFFKLTEQSHSAIFLDVWVPRKLYRKAISGCLFYLFLFFFQHQFCAA